MSVFLESFTADSCANQNLESDYWAGIKKSGSNPHQPQLATLTLSNSLKLSEPGFLTKRDNNDHTYLPIPCEREKSDIPDFIKVLQNVSYKY